MSLHTQKNPTLLAENQILLLILITGGVFTSQVEGVRQEAAADAFLFNLR